MNDATSRKITNTDDMVLKSEEAEARPVVVTTANRGVFFGYADDTDGDVIHLKRARNALYWSKETGGFLGLGGIGPQKGSRIGERADVELRGITAVVSCTPKAVEAWEAA